jgi:hypothetical protein
MKPYYAPTWETLAGKMFKTMEEAQAAEVQEMVSGEVRPVVKMYVKGRSSSRRSTARRSFRSTPALKAARSN